MCLNTVKTPKNCNGRLASGPWMELGNYLRGFLRLVRRNRRGVVAAFKRMWFWKHPYGQNDTWSGIWVGYKDLLQLGIGVRSTKILDSEYKRLRNSPIQTINSRSYSWKYPHKTLRLFITTNHFTHQLQDAIRLQLFYVSTTFHRPNLITPTIENRRLRKARQSI